MLTPEEKKEMLADGRNTKRALSFRAGQQSIRCSLDDYITFLDDFQAIFKPFKISKEITPTHANKL